MGLSHAYGQPVDKQTGIGPIRTVVESGVTFFEHPAEVYGPFTKRGTRRRGACAVSGARLVIPTSSASTSMGRQESARRRRQTVVRSILGRSLRPHSRAA